MDFLKKHYEKILLSLVLLGLAVTAAWLPMAIKSAQEDLQKSIVNLPEPKLFKSVSLSTNETTLKRLQNPQSVELSGAHNLFNPVTWKIKPGAKPEESFIKIVREGADAFIVTNIRPLFMELAFERVTASGYWIGIKRKGEKKPSVYAKEKEPKELFTLKEIKGAPENPDELLLELKDTQEIISIAKDKPFKRVEAHAADLRYPPDSKNFSNQKVGDIIPVAGESYKIIAITENEVRVQAISTDKRTTILWKGAPVASDSNSQQPKKP